MNSIPCILIPALVGLISALLGYLLGKSGSKPDDSELESLRSELESCRKKSAQLIADMHALKSAKTSQEFKSDLEAPSYPFDANLALSVFGSKIVANDLKIVEGIGPQIEELFHQAGIKTWKKLSETPVDKCQEILHNGGERFAIHNPSTWPKQSLLAYKGEWQELKNWQDQLKGGKE